MDTMHGQNDCVLCNCYTDLTTCFSSQPIMKKKSRACARVPFLVIFTVCIFSLEEIGLRFEQEIKIISKYRDCLIVLRIVIC